jgi:toluene monooxygenase system ferredoxin subunit
VSDGLTWVRALAEQDLIEGDMADVEIDGRLLLLARLPGGQVRAYQGECPHLGTPLAEGDWDPDTNVLTCSSHLWEFDLTDGTGVNPSDCALRQYRVRSEGPWLHVAIS